MCVRIGEWKTPSHTVRDYEYRCTSVTALSWPVELLSGEVYFDLSDMLKDKDCQFSCTDKDMSIDSAHRGIKPQTKPPAKFIIVVLVKHHTCSGIWHVFGWNIKSCRFKTTFFLCLFCIYFLCQFADSVLGWSLLSLVLTSSWMFVAHSFLNFCCCLCIASYFCRCLQLYIHLKITPFPPAFTPLSFRLFQLPPSFFSLL